MTANPAEVQQLREQLVLAQRRALLGDTSAMLAHEFNNLMTPVLARASFAISSKDSELHVQTLERIVTQVNKALDLSRHLLGYYAHGEVDRSDCSVLNVVESSLQDTIRPLSKDGVEVTLEVAESLRARGPAVLLEQVLLNLVLNARAALNNQRGRVHINAQHVEEKVLIEVHDSGAGIPADLREQVFQPFLSDTRAELLHSHEAIGLGLKLCRLILAQEQGSLMLSESSYGGCCFAVRWPAAPSVSDASNVSA